MSDRKALNIGITRFKNYEQFGLRGCVNDVANFRRVLVDNLEPLNSMYSSVAIV